MKSRKELVDDYELTPEGDEKLENDRSKGEVVKAIGWFGVGDISVVFTCSSFATSITNNMGPT